MNSVSWPTDHRKKSERSRSTKGKFKPTANDSETDYPCLEHGSLSALSLTSHGTGRLEWTSVSESSSVKRLHPRGQGVKIFPETQPPPLEFPTIAASKQAEQGANFLRTYFPDIEIPAELIRDEVETDARTTQDLEGFDPFSGNLLKSIQLQDGGSYLCFPMGESKRELNISPFVQSRNGDAIFKPVVQSRKTFQTPICQISGSSSGDCLAIRTFRSTSLLEIKKQFDSPPELLERVILENSDTGDRPVMDVKISFSPIAGILVNDQGVVYRCDFGSGWKSVQQVSRSAVPMTDPFWRLSVTDHEEGCILISDKTVQRLDWRSPNDHIDIFNICNLNNLLTAVKGSYKDHIIRLCSTKEILWLDSRFTRSPLLGYRHGRAFDRTLETRTVFLPDPQTLLTSRKNGLVSIYDVSRSEDGLIRSKTPVYSVPSISGYDTCSAGYSLFQHPTASSSHPEAITMYQLTDRGSIYALELDFARKMSRKEPREKVQWSSEVKNMVRRTISQTIGPRDWRNKTKVDLSPAYQQIFQAESAVRGWVSHENTQLAKEAIENMTSFWEGKDLPEHMLTMFDIAFHSSEQPVHSSRAAFLTQSDLNNNEGFRIVMQDRIPIQKITQNAPWQPDLSASLNILDPETPSDFQALECSQQFVLESSIDATAKLESETCEQLVLDLALSRDVFAPRNCKAPTDEDGLDLLGTMSRATEALSLDDEPAPIHLGFLHPKTQAPSSYSGAQRQQYSKELDGPLGVRLLLREWEIGSDPSEYTYEDPYDESNIDAPTLRLRGKLFKDVSKSQDSNIPLQSQRPPTILASKTIIPPILASSQAASSIQEQKPLALGAPTFRVESQTFVERGDGGVEDLMASALSGPHGGRQQEKKRPTKKRLGGF